MKVGIVTMPLCANYGGIIQNWALQKILIKLGHEPITLRFPVMYQGMSSLYYWLTVFPMQTLRFVVHKFIGGKYEMPLTIGAWRKSVQGMEHFVKEYINVTDYLPNLSMEDVRRYGIEVIVVGSDQIWRPVKYDAVKYYFLGFTGESDIMRIAYAPSIALEKWPFNEETTVQLKVLIKNFSAVSVREKSSVQLVKDNLGVDAQWVLDPTMLLKKDDYLELCKDVPQSQEPFVFAYILDMTDDKRKMVEMTARKMGCGVRFLSSGNVKTEDRIEKWLANFRDANFVITDSYHGTVFSLIFQKQFYCFYNSCRGNARMDSLKEISGLKSRFLIRSTDALGETIDYNIVGKRLKNMVDGSKEWLYNALKQFK